MAGISVIFLRQSRTSHSSAPPRIWTAPFHERRTYGGRAERCIEVPLCLRLAQRPAMRDRLASLAEVAVVSSFAEPDAPPTMAHKTNAVRMLDRMRISYELR